MKQVGAKWLVEMVEYISDNPRFIVNGFLWSGITGALDGDSEADDDLLDDSETDSNVNSSSDESET